MNESPLPPQVQTKAASRRFAPNGFTLVELLVAIGIILILSLIAFQATQSVRNQAARSRSMANMKTIVLAWNLYASEHNDLYPIGLTWTATAADVQNPPSELKTLNYRYWWRWYGGVAAYLPTLVISDTEAANNYGGPRAPAGWDQVWDGYFPAARIAELRKLSNAANTGYHFNTYMGYNRRIKRSRITDFSRVPILFAYWDDSNATNPMGRYFSSPLASDDRVGFMKGAPKAAGSGNYFAFPDGHLEWVPAMKTAQEYEARFIWRPY